MPIEGSTIIGKTTYLACPTSHTVDTHLLPSSVELDWSHDTVFLTHPQTFSTIDSPNVPDLTTTYTPSASCRDANPTFSPPTKIPTVYSVDPSSSIVSDASYSRCQLYGKATYSPGICPSGQTVAEITAYQSNVSTGYHTFWQASCCNRFGILIHSSPYTHISSQWHDIWPSISKCMYQYLFDALSCLRPNHYDSGLQRGRSHSCLSIHVLFDYW
jgi:hypothetical protein